MPVPFTPMQQQLMQLFVASADYKLSKTNHFANALLAKETPMQPETLYYTYSTYKTSAKKICRLEYCYRTRWRLSFRKTIRRMLQFCKNIA